MALDFLLKQVKDAIYKDDNTTYKDGDQHGLIGQIEGLFGGLLGGGQQQGNAPGTINNPLPASQDPYGDPGAGQQGYGNAGDLRQQFPNLRPASEDQYGDPADMENNPEALRRQFPGLKDASQDPYGDPADNEPQQGSIDDLRRQFPNLKSAAEDPYGDPADQR